MAIDKLLLLGCGNMGGAMLAGWLAAGVSPTRFAVLSKSLDAAPEGVELYRDVPADSDHDAVLLGFKPHQLGELSQAYAALTGSGVAIYSMLAGITLAQLQDAYPDADAHIRVMPNLAVRIGKSPVILSETGLDQSERDFASEFFGLLGSAVWLDDENKFDLVTALAGSGPGFVYRFIDAMAGAATELGLEPEQAAKLSLQMVEGAALLASQSDVNPHELANRVASPGGMTREGLNVLDADSALQNLLVKTLKATADRGAELAKAADK